MNEPILELSGATVVKDGRRVLDDVSLTIRAGEHTAILGPNGAGKSILVRLLTHDERPLAPVNGTAPVRVFGEQTWNIFDLRSQHHDLLRMIVADTVADPAELDGEITRLLSAWRSNSRSAVGAWTISAKPLNATIPIRESLA